MTSFALKVFPTAVRIALGLVLISAGLPKIFNSADFSVTLQNYQILPASLVAPTAHSVPVMETVVGVALVLGLFTRVSACFAALASVGFGVFVFSALARGLNIECGCFNGASKVSWMHAGLDVTMVLMSLYLARLRSTKFALDNISSLRNTLPERASIRVIIILSLTLVLSAYSHHRNPVPTMDTKQPTPTLSDSSQLTFEPSILHLGSVRQEDETMGKVSYRNHGTSTIRINRVETSCGCTEPVLTKFVLAPGESGELQVKFHPGSSQGESHQNVSVYIDGQRSPDVLSVVAQIDPKIAVVPGVIELKNVDDFSVVRLVANRPDLSFRITGVTILSETNSLRIQSDNNSQAGSQAELKVILVQRPPEKETSPIIPIKISTDAGGDCVLYVKIY